MIARRVLPLVVLIYLGGCRPAIQAYHGSVVGELARLRGFSVPCAEKLEIVNFDGEFRGFELFAAAGEHSLELEYRSEPYSSPHPRYTPDKACVQEVRYGVRLAVKTGRVYTFYVLADPHSEWPLSVIEHDSTHAVQGVEVSADTRTLERNEVCFPDWRTAGCLRRKWGE